MKKQSRNFGFMRPKCEQLAEAGASVEMHAHDDDPLTALSEARRFAEGLLKFYVRHRSDEREPDGFEALLDACSVKRLLPEEQLREFHKLRRELNPAPHDLGHMPQSRPVEYAERIWTLAKWVWEERKFGAVPAKFLPVRPGGDERHDMLAEIHAPFEPRNWFDPSQDVEPLLDFVPRELVFKAVEQFVSQNQQRVLLIKGPLGCGKSTLLAEFIQTSRSNGITCITFFFNKIHHQVRPRVWIQHIYAKFVQTYEAEIKELAKNVRDLPPSDLVNRLSNRLSEFADPTQRMLFVIDAVDEAGTAKDDVVSFLRSSLPKGVQVIATVRPDNLPVDLDPANDRDPTGISRVDLRKTEFVYASRKDGRRFVEQRLKSGLFSEGTLAEIARLGDGNFLALRGLATEVLAKKLSDSAVIGWLHDLARSGKIGEELTAELDSRAWERLKGSPDSIRILGLLAFAYMRLSTEMIVDSLGLKGDWSQLKQPVDEYLLHSEHDSDGQDDVIRYRLFHPAFVAFVGEKLKKERRTLETKLANAGRRWIREKKTGYARDYALRFAVQHLIEAECWDEMIAMLTDLKFIEARFVAEQGYELLEDYDRALRRHPETRQEFVRRDKQDERLQGWVAELVSYSRKCTTIREKFARGEISDCVTEVQKLVVPQPLDTSETIEDMKRAEAAQANPTAVRPESASIARLREFHWFVKSQFNVLREPPHTTNTIAANFAATGFVADAAKSARENSPTPQVALVRTRLTPATRSDSLVVWEFKDELKPSGDDRHWRDISITRIWKSKTLVGGDDRHWGDMTTNARIGYGNLVSHGDRIWDLRTRKRLLVNLGEFRVGAVTVDGCWAVVSSKRSDGAVLQLIDVRRETVVAETHWFEPQEVQSCWKAIDVTPDGKRVAFIDRLPDAAGRFSLVVWDTDTNTRESISIGKRKPSQVLICLSGMIAVIRQDISPKEPTIVATTKPIYQFVDLTSFPRIRRIRSSRALALLAHWGFKDDVVLSERMKWQRSTSDGKLEVADFIRPEHDAVIIRQVGNRESIRHFSPKRFSPKRPFDFVNSISADGRYAFALTDKAFCFLDLANGTLRQEADVPVEPTVTAQSDVAGREELELANELQLSLQEAFDCAEEEATASQAREAWANLGNIRREHEYAQMFGAKEDEEWTLRDTEESLRKERLIESLSPKKRLILSLVSSRQRVDRRPHTTLPAVLSPDGSVLVSCHISTHECNSDFFCFRPDANLRPPISALVRDFTTGNEIPIEGDLCEGRCERDALLGFTRDGKAILFQARGGGQLRTWSIDNNDWRAPLKGRWGITGPMEDVAEFTPFVSPVVQSPDGRKVLLGWGTEIVHLNRLTDKGTAFETPLRITPWCDNFRSAAFSPDGKYLIAGYQDDDAGSYGAVRIWKVETGECLSVVDTPARPTKVDWDGTLRDQFGRDIDVRVYDSHPGPAWVTGVRLFRFQPTANDQTESPSATAIQTERPVGRFDDEITFRCRKCAERTPLPPAVVSAVDQILKAAGLSESTSPVLELPDAEWNATGLNFECPKCHKPHRSTPFYVDRRR